MRWAVLAVLVALAGACSGDDTDDDGAAPTAASSTTAAEPVDPAADAARAEEILLKPTDLPEGWTPVPEPEGAEAEQGRLEGTFAGCLGVPAPAEQPSADSPEYVTGTLTQVSARVEMAPSVEVAEAEFANLQRPRYLECVARQFDESQADSGLTFAPSRAERLDFPDLGDGTLATRITTLLTVDGREVSIYADVVFVVKGRAQMTLYLLKGGEPFPAELANSLARRMAARA